MIAHYLGAEDGQRSPFHRHAADQHSVHLSKLALRSRRA
jgi:hypothetical protein